MSSLALAHALTLFHVGPAEIEPATPDYERLMRISTDLYRFVSVCTSLFCNRIIVKEFMDLYPYGRNTGTKTGTSLSFKYNII